MKTSKAERAARERKSKEHSPEILCLLTPLEISIFNRYHRTLDISKTSQALHIKRKECVITLKSVFSKLRAFYRLHSKVEAEVNASLFPKHSLLDEPIETLGFSTRLRHILKDGGCETLRDLLLNTEHDFKRFRGMGKASLAELKTELAKQGFGQLWR
jgi:DNA-directed RNA polymerase alpha subunit